MSASSFRCPHCSTMLRVRDRKFIGRQIPCPDCRQPIEIVADGPRGLSGRPGAVASAKPSDSQQPAARGRLARMLLAVFAPWRRSGPRPADAAPGRWSRAAAVLASPVGVAWTVAGAFTLGLVVLIWPSGGSSPRAGADDSRGPANTAADALSPRGNGTAAPPAGSASRDVEDQIRERLVRLGQRLDGYRDVHGHFPAGTAPARGLAPADRFSWLAELAADGGRPDRPQPLWDQKWHDPLNDRFVRQPQPEFLNPAVAEQTGRNRFPATHFVGMAGVGPDAAELPVTHPRAGIFGYDRRTRIEDIKDGTANTILAAGVQDRLGGWAGGGPGSVRGLTREPYVNGPDGFGTGQRDSMLVLMADGSVRTISKQTSPVIVRRLAAMADGFPLDETVPGEPGDPPPQPATPEPPRPLDVADDRAPPDDSEPVLIEPPAEEPPVDERPVVAPQPVPVIDIAAALAQQIEHYEVPRPVAVRRLLEELEEMAGVPVEANGGNSLEVDARLDQTMSLRLEKTTVGEILDEVTRRARLEYTLGAAAIHVRLAER